MGAFHPHTVNTCTHIAFVERFQIKKTLEKPTLL